MSATNSFDFWLEGLAGQRYIIQASSNFVNWSPVQTNTLASNSLQIVMPATNAPYQFYRAQWTP